LNATQTLSPAPAKLSTESPEPQHYPHDLNGHIGLLEQN